MSMSRSRRRSLVEASPSGKKDKQRANGALRLRSRLTIAACQDWDNLVLPLFKEVSDIWGM